MRKKNRIRIKIGNWVKKVGERICGKYWKCTECGCIKYVEKEIGCWQCEVGEMIYQG